MDYNQMLNVDKNRSWFFLGLIILLTVAVYYQLPTFEFQTTWDDQWVVINEYTSSGGSAINFWRIFSEFYNGQYAPINEAYYTLLYIAFGYEPKVYHLGSIALHLGNVYLAYQLFRLLLTGCKMTSQKDGNHIALLTAAIFAFHPLMVESVAWVSASKILLYTCFYLFGLIFYIRYLITRAKRYMILVAIFFIASFLSKEQAVTFPICLVLIDYLFYKKQIPKSLWINKILFSLLSLFFAYITMLSQHEFGQGVLSSNVQYPLYQRLIYSFYAVFSYFTKCLIPVKLSYLYPFPNRIGEPLPIEMLIYPVLILILLFTLYRYLKYRWAMLGVGFFFFHLLTVIHLIPIARFVIIADRYVYLSSLGCFFLIAYSIIYFKVRFKRYSNLILASTLIYLLALSGYSFERIKVWRNGETLRKEIRQILTDKGYKLTPLNVN